MKTSRIYLLFLVFALNLVGCEKDETKKQPNENKEDTEMHLYGFLSREPQTRGYGSSPVNLVEINPNDATTAIISTEDLNYTQEFAFNSKTDELYCVNVRERLARLLILNIKTGKIRYVDIKNSEDSYVSGLFFNEKTLKLYGLLGIKTKTKGYGRSPVNLVEINPNNGTTTIVFKEDLNYTQGCAFDSKTNNLYGVNFKERYSPRLLKMNIETGKVKYLDITNNGKKVSFFDDLFFNEKTLKLYALLSTERAVNLAEINPNDGTTNVVFTEDLDDTQGWAFNSKTNDLYGVNFKERDPRLLTMNIKTGKTKYLYITHNQKKVSFFDDLFIFFR